MCFLLQLLQPILHMLIQYTLFYSLIPLFTNPSSFFCFLLSINSILIFPLRSATLSSSLPLPHLSHLFSRTLTATLILTLSPPSLYSCSLSAVVVSPPSLCSPGPESLSPSAFLAGSYGNTCTHAHTLTYMQSTTIYHTNDLLLQIGQPGFHQYVQFICFTSRSLLP